AHSSELAAQVGLKRAALEGGDGGRRVERLGAMLLTALMRVAELAAAVARDRRQPLAARCIAHVVKKGKGAIERSRSQVILVPAHRIAGGITHPAIDAFDASIGCRAGCTRGADPLDWIVSRLARGEHALSPVPLRKEGLHVADQILDDAQVGERTDLHAAVSCHPRYVSA